MKTWCPERANLVIEREGRTRKWLALQCGVSPVTVTHYLSGRRSPSNSVLKLMASALNTTEAYLLGQKAEPGRKAS